LKSNSGKRGGRAASVTVRCFAWPSVAAPSKHDKTIAPRLHHSTSRALLGELPLGDSILDGTELERQRIGREQLLHIARLKDSVGDVAQINLGVVKQQSEVSRAVRKGRLGQRVDEEATERLLRQSFARVLFLPSRLLMNSVSGSVT